MPRILMSLLLLLTAHAWAQGPIEIVRATYGAGRTQVDVTEKVRAAMVNGAIQLTVRGENLGGDPVRSERAGCRESGQSAADDEDVGSLRHGR